MSLRLQGRVRRVARRLPRPETREQAAVRAALRALGDDELLALEAALVAELAGQPPTPEDRAALAAYRRQLRASRATPGRLVVGR